MKQLLPFVLIGGLLLSSPARAGQQPATSGNPPVLSALRLTEGEDITIDGRLDEGGWRRRPSLHGIQAIRTGHRSARHRANRDPASSSIATASISGLNSTTPIPTVFSVTKWSAMGPLPQTTVSCGRWTRFSINAAVISSRSTRPARWATHNWCPPRAAAVSVRHRIAHGTVSGRLESRATMRGWTAEIEIPFRTLNFDPQAEAWGANFQRTVRRKNEERLLDRMGPEPGPVQPIRGGPDRGNPRSDPGAWPRCQTLHIGNLYRRSGAQYFVNISRDVGLDLFYSVTPQLKGNFTLNTDFAQTEVDDRQVNLTRYRLFFPEKRDFFLEGASNFDFSRDPARNLGAFFSRRIGLTENGQPQTIDYGAKLIGRVGNFDLGVLQVRTTREGEVLGEDFTVLRPSVASSASRTWV